MSGAILDASVGAAGGIFIAWFLSPLSESPQDPDSWNIVVMIGAILGAVVLVAVSKGLRGK